MLFLLPLSLIIAFTLPPASGSHRPLLRALPRRLRVVSCVAAEQA
uniref:Uncharacterized protein n=1 Tax=Setaria viridis TaxID=4556 RepID=A0A4U6THL1_SETVI|nr:hypothetical protein SEVIR_8G204001v2 [Setaria viridis]